MFRNLIRTAVLAPVLVLAIGCDDNDMDKVGTDERLEMGDDADARRVDGVDRADVKKGDADNPFRVDDRLEWEKAVDRRLDDVDARLVKMREEMAQKGTDVEGTVAHEVSELEEAAREAREDLGEISARTDEGWKELTRELDLTVESLEDRLSRVKIDADATEANDPKEVDEPLDGEPGH